MLDNPLLVTIDELFIRDGDHNAVNTEVLISADGVFGIGDKYTVLNGVVQGLGSLAASTDFWFTSSLIGVENEIYLETLTVSEVPVPAALPLLLVGLGGFGVVARRKRKTA